MAITRSTWIDDDGTGTTGTILNNAELQKIYTNIDAFVDVWLAPPFNAAHFQNMTVAVGNVETNRYTITGKTLTWILTINNATIVGTPNTLGLVLPGGLIARNVGTVLVVGTGPNVAWGPLKATTVAGGAVLNIGRLDFSNFSPGVGAYVWSAVVVEVQ